MLDSLAAELLVACFSPLSAIELTAVAATSRRYRRAASADVLWQRLVLAAGFALPPCLAAAAARRAGSWRELYRDESIAGKRAAPWKVAGRHSLDAFVARGLLTTSAAADTAVLDGLSPGAAAPGPSTPGAAAVAPLAIVFLVDGSGSVTDDDFEACRSAVVRYAAQVPEGSLVSVLQFSAHVVVEVPFAGSATEDGAESDGDGGSDEDDEGGAARPRVAAVAPPFDLDAFTTAVSAIQRINGATYISIALRKAAAMFSAPECNAARRCVVLLTDGRVSTDEATAAAAEAASQAASPHAVEHYALGVGRGVDSDALMRIIGPNAPPERAAERYLALRTLDEAEW